MTLVASACPVCDGTRFEPRYAGTIAAAGSDAAAYFSSSRRSAAHPPIVRCVACGLWLASPRDDDATLARIYAGLVDPAYAAEESNRARTAIDHLAFVRRHCGARGQLLDIGCATGVFVRAAHADGWDASGIDASVWAIERARERCVDGRFVRGLVEEVEWPAASLDVVTLWDALEHLPAPAAVLSRAREWLRPGGWIFLNVPNCESLMARLLGRRWVLLLREHLWYFSPRTISALLDRVGFRCIETRPNTVRFSASSIAARLAQSPGAGRLTRALAAAPLPRRLALRFPIGEMNVAGQRRG